MACRTACLAGVRTLRTVAAAPCASPPDRPCAGSRCADTGDWRISPGRAGDLDEPLGEYELVPLVLFLRHGHLRRALAIEVLQLGCVHLLQQVVKPGHGFIERQLFQALLHSSSSSGAGTVFGISCRCGSRDQGSSYLRRPVSPAIHLGTRSFFLTLAAANVSYEKRDAGAFGNRGALRLQEAPAEASSRTLAGSSGPRGPGVAFRHPRSAICVPCPHFGIRHSPAAPHGRIDVGRLIRSTEAVATHDIAAARAAAIGQGLLDLHPPTGFLPGAGRCRVRCWIQTPRRWQRRADLTGRCQGSGDKVPSPSVGRLPPLRRRPAFYAHEGGGRRDELAPLLAPPRLRHGRQPLTRPARQVGVS